MNNLPTLGKSDSEMELPYLLTQDMGGNHVYKWSNLFDIRYEQGKDRPYFRIIFEFDHNGETKYISYLTSDKVSDKTKLGEFIIQVLGEIPDTINMNDFMVKAKQYSYRVYIQIVNRYPTVTNILEVKHMGQTVLPKSTPQETPTQPSNQPEPQVSNPPTCIYCSEPLPPNKALWTETTFEGNQAYLCPKHKDSM